MISIIIALVGLVLLALIYIELVKVTFYFEELDEGGEDDGSGKTV